MSPLEKAQQILDQLVDKAADESFTLPTQQYPQTGDPVIACALFTVAVSSVLVAEAYGPNACNASQLGTFSIVIARDCGNTSRQDGSDDPAAVAAVSQTLSADGEFLWSWINNYIAYLSKEWSVSYVIQGGLSMATMQLTTGID